MDTLVRTDPAQNVRNNIAAVIVVAVPVAVPVFFEEQSTSCPPSICSSLAVLRINNIVTAEAREQVISAISTADPDPDPDPDPVSDPDLGPKPDPDL